MGRNEGNGKERILFNTKNSERVCLEIIILLVDRACWKLAGKQLYCQVIDRVLITRISYLHIKPAATITKLMTQHAMIKHALPSFHSAPEFLFLEYSLEFKVYSNIVSNNNKGKCTQGLSS